MNKTAGSYCLALFKNMGAQWEKRIVPCWFQLKPRRLTSTILPVLAGRLFLIRVNIIFTRTFSRLAGKILTRVLLTQVDSLFFLQKDRTGKFACRVEFPTFGQFVMQESAAEATQKCSYVLWHLTHIDGLASRDQLLCQPKGKIWPAMNQSNHVVCPWHGQVFVLRENGGVQ